MYLLLNTTAHCSKMGIFISADHYRMRPLALLG